MAFVTAMNTPLTKSGAKGSDVYTEAGTGDFRVALFQQLVRGCKASYIQSMVKDAFTSSTDGAVLRDYAVMAFQTRNVRGGKGERDIFYHLFLAIIEERPSMLTPLLKLIPTYGAWLDLWHIWLLVSPTTQVATVQAAIIELVKATYEEDHKNLDAGNHSISLLGKWLPRESSKFHIVAEQLANALHPDISDQNDRWRAYRKGCARLNAALKTTEIAMCGGTWATINPGAVPGRLLAKCRKAFLNEIIAKNGRPSRSPRSNEPSLRYPDSADRNACREHFLAHTKKVLAGEVTAKGADTVYPHELARKYINSSSVSSDESAMIEAQWKAIREATASAGGLNRAVAMCDFSGSMSGVPMEVSMALGILVSEITHPAFRDYILGFDSTPNWISFVGKATLEEKVHHAINYAQGLSTNFQAACDLILQRLVEHKVPVDEAPTDLIVFTDMGFDAACGMNHGNYTKVAKGAIWETHVQMIQRSYTEAGYTPPRIVLWNLRAEYKDFHAKAHDEGVVVLSGWSPSLLKALSNNGVQVKTPYEGLREILDHPQYDAVRAAWNNTVDA